MHLGKIHHHYVVVHSSSGELVVKRSSGQIIAVVLEDNEDENTAHLEKITQFNFAEFKRHYGKLDDEYDILDLGYWFDNPRGPNTLLGLDYADPDNAWRAQIKKEKREREQEAKHNQAHSEVQEDHTKS